MSVGHGIILRKTDLLIAARHLRQAVAESQGRELRWLGIWWVWTMLVFGLEIK